MGSRKKIAGWKALALAAAVFLAPAPGAGAPSGMDAKTSAPKKAAAPPKSVDKGLAKAKAKAAKKAPPEPKSKPPAAPGLPDPHACVQGNPQDLRLVMAFQNAKDPVIEAFRRHREERERALREARTLASAKPAEKAKIPVPWQKPNSAAGDAIVAAAWVPCVRVDEQMRQLERTIRALKRAIQPPVQGRLVQKQIRQSCIDASLRRTHSARSYFCASERSEKIRTNPPGPEGPCVSSELAEFMQFAFTQAIECVSAPGNLVDPRIIIKKVNNESAFHFYQAVRGGVGIGQLTPIAVEQLAYEAPKFLLDRVVNNNANKACAPFKALIEKDLRAGEVVLPDHKDPCYWIAVDRGLARNILYSTALFAYNRDWMRDRKRGGNPRLTGAALDYTALVSFGPGGPNEVMAIAEDAPRTADEVIKQSDYLQKTQETWEYLEKLVTYGSPKGAVAADRFGDACVEPVP